MGFQLRSGPHMAHGGFDIGPLIIIFPFFVFFYRILVDLGI